MQYFFFFWYKKSLELKKNLKTCENKFLPFYDIRKCENYTINFCIIIRNTNLTFKLIFDLIITSSIYNRVVCICTWIYFWHLKFSFQNLFIFTMQIAATTAFTTELVQHIYMYVNKVNNYWFTPKLFTNKAHYYILLCKTFCRRNFLKVILVNWQHVCRN